MKELITFLYVLALSKQTFRQIFKNKIECEFIPISHVIPYQVFDQVSDQVLDQLFGHELCQVFDLALN